MTQNALWHEAAAMAARAHRHQIRKDGRTPYFSHPARVALTVAVKFGCTDEKILAAAFLHDVLEDTLADYDDILERFGDKELAEWVAALSKDPRLVESEREVEYDRQLAEADWQARLIKLADVHDNLSDAIDDEARRKLIGKAERALDLAKDDPQLREASAIVRALVEDSQPQLQT